MRKQDNPVFIFGVIAAAVFLFLIVWISFPGCNKVLGAAPIAVQKHASVDDSPCFLVLSDIHLHSNLLQADISDREADTGNDLWDTSQNKIRTILAGKSDFAKPGFIIVLGDLPWHANALNTGDLESAHNNSGKALRDLRTLAQGAQIPLLYVCGNNDPWDGDYQPFSSKLFDMDTACKNCWPVIQPATANPSLVIDNSKVSLGYYSAYPLGNKSKLRFIALNTTMFVHRYADKDGQQSATASQMKWFEQQLTEAKANKEFVLIAMHVPPGMDGYKKKDFWKDKLNYNGTELQNAFLDLLDKYQANIIGLLSSHTHMDGLRKLYSRNGRLTAIDISVPGIAPGYGNNPGFKLINYHPQNFELLNFTTFYEDYFPAQKVVGWGNQYFDFRTEFGCPVGTSIRTFLDTLNQNSLQKSVQVIYKVKNGEGRADEVAAAMNVRYE